ncbi:SulP family inorganic anion transporter [Kangiella sp. TOML190]|uniref:SulP family inorganic anion transporter n=1 Tax=Kangiella sp. TOML190 TaxID=2931351 RepID=UPI00203F9E8D|nr:SulP family inorganic anion transporter [Kangiella sp. TOML190]
MIDLIRNTTASAKNDILSGLTVALALVPEAVAFAFVAGVEPLVGLYAAFMVGLITSIFGGRPGMISGATGALAVVMVALVAQHGVEYLFATVVLMGLIQMLAGWLKLGKFIRMVPHSVMMGFVNGLAIVIFLAQIPSLQSSTPEGKWGWLEGTWLQGESLWLMLGLIVLTMMIIQFLPKLTKAIPSSLAAILIVSLLAIGFSLPSKTVGDVASIAGGFPQFHIPSVPLNFETLKIIFPYAFILAAIGLIESLLTLRLIDEITETRGQSNKECFAQGLANTTTGFFGGMGGCAMIGQSMINVNSGGRGRLSGITAAIALLIFILFASPLIEKIPVAALVGVMFIVVIGTFEWSSFRIMRKIPGADAFVLITVSIVTVLTDLAVAVFVGVILSALVFAWQSAKRVRVRRQEKNGKAYYTVRGPLFFGSTTHFSEQFSARNDLDEVYIDFADSRVWDHSGIEAIDALAVRYESAGKKLHLLHLSPDCQRLLTKAGAAIEVDTKRDPKYFVADDELAG